MVIDCRSQDIYIFICIYIRTVCVVEAGAATAVVVVFSCGAVDADGSDGKLPYEKE